VPDDPRPPVAIRITRPYATEAEYLDRETETLTRTSITLVGAQERPQGVVLRFEVALSSGAVLVRGEGRVIGFKPDALEGLPGLTLRFTRLDTRSKTLIDKAAALREKRRPSTRPETREAPAGAKRHPSAAPPPAAPPPAPPPEQDMPAASVPRGPPDTQVGGELGRAAAEPVRLEPRPPTAHRDDETTHASPSREALLEKLRARAKALDSAAVQRILDQRRHRA
jgi:hypothetical protein